MRTIKEFLRELKTGDNASRDHQYVTWDDNPSDGTIETITRAESSSEFKMEVDDYMADNKTYQIKKERWEENRPRTQNLILQHCPPELEARLTSQAKWDLV